MSTSSSSLSAVGRPEFDGASHCLVQLTGLGPLIESLGEETSVLYLEEFEERLKSVSRSEDSLIRLSPDKYCIILNGVSEREHLGGLGVCPIDKNQGSQVVCHCETTELVWIQAAPVVVENHAAAHDEDAQRVCLIDEMSQRVSPSGRSSAFFNVEPERTPDLSGGAYDIAGQVCDANECERLLSR